MTPDAGTPDAGTPDAGSGRLTLVGTPIGNLGDLSARAVETLRTADVVAAEDTRRTRALMTAAGVGGGSRLVAVHEHNEEQQAARLVARMRAGSTVAYVTDAGMPGISDPGERLVRRTIEAGILVSVVPGPSAVLAALVVSGFPAGRFCFEGFLPTKASERRQRLAGIVAEERTVVVFESPRRVGTTLADLARVLDANRKICVARELTKLHEEIIRTTVGNAAATHAASDGRGEYVLVIAPAEPPGEASDERVRAAVHAALDRGSTARDAAGEVARDLGVSRRRAYEMASALRRELR